MMIKVRQILLGLLIGLPCFLHGMKKAPLAPEQAVQDFERYIEELRKKGSAQDQARREFQEHNMPPEARASLKIEVKDVLQQFKDDPSFNPQAMLDEVMKELDEDTLREQKEREDALKWKNTLLTPVNIPVGIYKRDFADGLALAADVAGDVILYRQLLKRRILVVKEALKQDYNALMEVMGDIITEEEKFDRTYDEKSALGKAGAAVLDPMKRLFGMNRDALVNPLRNYISKKHVLVGVIPLNKMILFPLLARWGWDKVCMWLEEQLSPSADRPGVFEIAWSLYFDDKLPASAAAYQYNAAGELVEAADTPFSVVTLARWLKGFFYSPIRDASRWSGPRQIQMINKFLNLGMPDILFSDSVQLAVEFLGLGFSAKYFDFINTNVWTQFVLGNRDELLSLLKAYKKAEEGIGSTREEIEVAEKALMEFVERGHEQVSLIPGVHLRQWWTSRQLGEYQIPFWTWATVAGLVGFKAFMWYRNMRNESQQTQTNT